jgi:hypothetical protein
VEEEVAAKLVAEQAKAVRIVAEEAAVKLAAEEAEASRLEAEEEAEAARIAVEKAAAAKLAVEEEAEASRLKAEEEAEAARIVVEEAAAEKAEAARLAEEEETARIVAEHAAARLAAEQAGAAKLAVEEDARLEAERTAARAAVVVEERLRSLIEEQNAAEARVGAMQAAIAAKMPPEPEPEERTGSSRKSAPIMPEKERLEKEFQDAMEERRIERESTALIMRTVIASDPHAADRAAAAGFSLPMPLTRSAAEEGVFRLRSLQETVAAAEAKLAETTAAEAKLAEAAEVQAAVNEGMADQRLVVARERAKEALEIEKMKAAAVAQQQAAAAQAAELRAEIDALRAERKGLKGKIRTEKQQAVEEKKELRAMVAEQAAALAELEQRFAKSKAAERKRKQTVAAAKMAAPVVVPVDQSFEAAVSTVVQADAALGDYLATEAELGPRTAHEDAAGIQRVQTALLMLLNEAIEAGTHFNCLTPLIHRLHAGRLKVGLVVTARYKAAIRHCRQHLERARKGATMLHQLDQAIDAAKELVQAIARLSDPDPALDTSGLMAVVEEVSTYRQQTADCLTKVRRALAARRVHAMEQAELAGRQNKICSGSQVFVDLVAALSPIPGPGDYTARPRHAADASDGKCRTIESGPLYPNRLSPSFSAQSRFELENKERRAREHHKPISKSMTAPSVSPWRASSLGSKALAIYSDTPKGNSRPARLEAVDTVTGFDVTTTTESARTRTAAGLQQALFPDPASAISGPGIQDAGSPAANGKWVQATLSDGRSTWMVLPVSPDEAREPSLHEPGVPPELGNWAADNSPVMPSTPITTPSPAPKPVMTRHRPRRN